jgi:DNA-binding transcriptional LysR family regulator
MLDVRKLVLLRELSARGTVAAVAESLAYTPSAVSQGLAALQREAGVALTERVGRRLRLTDAGLRLVVRAEALLEQLEAAEAELQAAAGTVAGTLRVAALQTPLMALVPGALTTLGARHPDLRVELVEAEPETSLPAVALGELDVAIAEEYDGEPRALPAGVEREELMRDEVLLVLPAGHALAAGDGPVSLAALAGETWACSKSDTHFSQMHARACRTLGGFEPDVPYRANDIALMLVLVSSGHAVALAPSLGRPERVAGVVVRRLAEAELGRTVSAFRRAAARERPAVRALVEALREAA